MRALSEAKNDHGVGHMPNVVLFPWLTMLIGCCVYYLISRFKVKMPYTAIMFIVSARYLRVHLILTRSSMSHHGLLNILRLELSWDTARRKELEAML